MNALPTADREDPTAQVIAEYMRRVDAGEAVDRQRFLDEHPQLAGELRRYFDDVALVEQLAGPTVAEQSSSSAEARDPARRETVLASQSDSVPRKGESTAGGLLAGKFGRYEIERTLGEGAMGTVYLARDTELHRQVALKVPKFGAGDGEMMERFYREARAAAGLRHRHICPVYDIGEIDGVKYISIGFIEGRPLSAYVSPDKPQSERNVALIVRKLALALDAAHKEGIVHRDLKPPNVMVDKEGEPVIMDFGLARQMNKPESERLTQTGTIMGSPAYMSPEQVNADMERIGPPTDVYSLGVMLYELLTGRLPYEGSIAAVIGQILVKEPQKPSELRPDLDPRLEAICAKMMAKEVRERYGSMKEAAKALAEYLKSAGKGDARRSAGPLESVAPVGLNEFAATASIQRRTSGQAAANPSAASAPAPQASGGRNPPVGARVRQAFDGLKNLSGRTKAIAGGCAALVLVLGIIVIIRVGDQTVEVKSDDPNTRIDIEGGKIGISTTGGDGTGSETGATGPAEPAEDVESTAAGTADPVHLIPTDHLDDLATGQWQPVLTSPKQTEVIENIAPTWKDGIIELAKPAGGHRSGTLKATAGPRGKNIIIRGEVDRTDGHYASLILMGPEGGTNVAVGIEKKGFLLGATGKSKVNEDRPPADTTGYRDIALAIINGHVAVYVDEKLIIKRPDWIDVEERSPAISVLTWEETASRAQFRNLRVMVLGEDPSAAAEPRSTVEHAGNERDWLPD